MQFNFLQIVVVVFSVLLSGCTLLAQDVEPIQRQPQSVVKQIVGTLLERQTFSEWSEISPGAAMLHLPYQYESQTYNVLLVRLDQSMYELVLAYNPDGFTLREAQETGDVIVMNSGFFKEDNDPVGLLYIDGVRLDNHRIRPEGTSLVQIEPGSTRIRELSSQMLQEGEVFANALQAYPTLISAGELMVSSSLVEPARRSAIGIDVSGNIYLITSPYPYLGLYRFAEVLVESPIQFEQVLNLDGGGSTGILIDFPEYKDLTDTQTLVPTVLKVRRR